MVALLLLIPYTSAYRISAEPTEIIINARPGEQACRDITLVSDAPVETETRWSATKSRQLIEYQYTSDEMGIQTNIPENIPEGNQQVRVCITTPDTHAYHGVMIFHGKDKSAGIGIWATINPNGKVKQVPQPSLSQNTITGAAILDSPTSRSSTPYYLLIGEFLFMLILATVLAWMYRMQKKTSLRTNTIRAVNN